MEHSDFFGERPSVLPASTALRVSILRRRNTGCAVVPTDVPVSHDVWAGFGVCDVPATASRMRLLSDVQPVDQGRSVPVTAGVPAFDEATGLVAAKRSGAGQIAADQFTSKHLTSKQLDSKHLNVAPMYRLGGIGGAPPRGRPD